MVKNNLTFSSKYNCSVNHLWTWLINFRDFQNSSLKPLFVICNFPVSAYLPNTKQKVTRSMWLKWLAQTEGWGVRIFPVSCSVIQPWCTNRKIEQQLYIYIYPNIFMVILLFQRKIKSNSKTNSLNKENIMYDMSTKE